MGRIGFPELIVILVIVLVIFGGAKIPEIMKSFGQGIKEFKKAVNEKEEPKDGQAGKK